jgi:hypothetical protein
MLLRRGSVRFFLLHFYCLYWLAAIRYYTTVNENLTTYSYILDLR